MDSANLEKFKDQIKKSVLLDHYLPFIKLEDSGSRCVLICQCRQTNVSVTVTVQELPSSYNSTKSILEKAYTHPQLTPLINCIDDTKAKLLIGVSTNPSGEYLEDYLSKNKNKTKPFFRRNVQFIMVKLLSMLNTMHERGIGLYPFNEKSVILTTTNGGDVIDLVVRRCHLYGNSNSATKQKAHLLYVAQKLGYIGDIIEDADLTKIELDFFRACHRDSKVTVAELMEMQYIKKDPESWFPKNKVIGGYVFNIKPVTKDNAVVPEVAEAAPVSVDKPVKMFDLSSLSDVGPATVSVPKPVEDDNISVHTAIEDDLLEWSITISLGNGSPGLSPTIKTVEDFIKKHATLINTAAEGSDDSFGFRLPNVAKSFKPGHYRFKSAFIKFGSHRQITFVDRINFCGAALLILFNDHGIEHVRQGNKIYKTFDSMPSQVADYLVAARLAINKLDAVAPIYIASSKKYNSKFMLHRNWTITLQNGDYEVALTSEDIINQTEMSTLVTNENCLKTLEMALKMLLREQCSPKNQRFYPDCYFKGNQMKVAPAKYTGTVKYYSYEHDSGFITRDDNEEDIFVQRFSIAKSALRPFERYLVAGEKVEFNVGEYKTGDPEAVNVTGPDGSEVEGDYVLIQRKRFP